MTPSISVANQLGTWQRNFLLVGIGGALASIVGLLLDREQFLRSYLIAFVFWLGMALGCLGILMLHYTVGGKWGLPLRRLCEAGARTIPLTAVFVIPILLSIPAIYPWAKPEAAQDLNLRAKSGYLNVTGVVVRAVLYFAVWSAYAIRLSAISRQQDEREDATDKARAISAPGLVVFTFMSTFAFIDWIMSLEPHWYSTIYGAMFLIGQVLGAFALTIGLVVWIARSGVYGGFITRQHLHDLGNLMFAFMVLWAYLAFSQFLIIWSGNLPDEIPWYLRRLHNGWGWVALVLVAFHFAAPFALLLLRRVKRHAEPLLRVCALMFVARVVAHYWTIAPSFDGNRVHIHWLDVATFVGAGGLWFAAFFAQLKSRPLLPLRDPQLVEAPRETVAF